MAKKNNSRFIKNRSQKIARQKKRRATAKQNMCSAPWWKHHSLYLRKLFCFANFAPEYSTATVERLKTCIILRCTVKVDTFCDRKVAIIFGEHPENASPVVMVDGPKKPLRHRYEIFRPTSLCLWYPKDPEGRRWRHTQGLTMLLDLIRIHLFKEATYRLTSEWPWEEVHLEKSHSQSENSPRRESHSHRRRKSIQRHKSIRKPCWCGSKERYMRCHKTISLENEHALIFKEEKFL